jgi:adenosylcobyric acid synthase
MFSTPNTLMVQGTTSDAGKSILVTALCRILARHKISVAPFKSQNMALNSAVTPCGGEIGRAQAVQAQACFLSPSIEMNPILLKPNSDLGSQVIVNGKSIGNMKATEYHRYKPDLLNTVVAAHELLSQRYQTVIVEGAGSPAEINLREHDIANMGFAEKVDCPVIIVADIDRGGVFAHLYGTYALLSDTEKARVIGFVINRFRGDVDLLTPGLVWLEEKTSVPTLAVIPYIHDLHIEAEDSISNNQSQKTEDKRLKIVVINYPRTSNHTDFDVLRMYPHIDCEFIKEASDFSGADVIVLPGSKNVRGDLAAMQSSGWPELINRHLRYGGKVIGICGGFQMLGEAIHDPQAIESAAGSSRGLGLLQFETTLAGNKTLRNVKGVSLTTGAQVCGYEIHAGVSTGTALASPLLSLSFQNDDGSFADSKFNDGAISTDGKIIGTYVHGAFDEKAMLAEILTWAGLTKLADFDYKAYRENEINRLADVVEKELPITVLKKLLSLSVVS